MKQRKIRTRATLIVSKETKDYILSERIRQGFRNADEFLKYHLGVEEDK